MASRRLRPYDVHVTEHALYTPNKANVRLITMAHGFAMPENLQWMETLGSKTRKIIEDELKDYPGLILTEGFKVGAGILPRKFHSRAEPAETEEMAVAIASLPYRGLSEKEAKHVALAAKVLAVSTIAFGFLQQLNEYLRPPIKVQEQSPRKKVASILAKATKRGKLGPFKREDVLAYTGLLQPFRSFLLAGKIYRKAEKEANIALVAGAGHGKEVQKFLENPELFVKYGRFAERAMKDIEELKPLRKEALELITLPTVCHAVKNFKSTTK